MGKHEATERLNELAWYLTDLADEIEPKWQPSVKRWGNDENNVFDIGRTIEQWLDGTDDVAMQIELHLESGPARRERFADVVVGIWDEARAIERTIVLGNPDPFRWAREDIHSAAAEFPNELRRTGEYLWGLYELMGGKPASDEDEQDDEAPAAPARQAAPAKTAATIDDDVFAMADSILGN